MRTYLVLHSQTEDHMGRRISFPLCTYAHIPKQQKHKTFRKKETQPATGAVASRNKRCDGE